MHVCYCVCIVCVVCVFSCVCACVCVRVLVYVHEGGFLNGGICVGEGGFREEEVPVEVVKKIGHFVQELSRVCGLPCTI